MRAGVDYSALTEDAYDDDEESSAALTLKSNVLGTSTLTLKSNVLGTYNQQKATWTDRLVDLGATKEEDNLPDLASFFIDKQWTRLKSIHETLEPVVAKHAHLEKQIEQSIRIARQTHDDWAPAREFPYMSTSERATALIYTMQADPSVYQMMNNALRDKHPSGLQLWCDHVWLTMVSLAHTPPLPEPLNRSVVFRGVDKPYFELDAYHVGKIFTLRGFSSFSLDKQVVEQFLGERPNECTIYYLELTQNTARSVKRLSLFPMEDEVLLPPNTKFQVEGIVDRGEGLHVIHCREISTPTKQNVFAMALARARDDRRQREQERSERAEQERAERRQREEERRREEVYQQRLDELKEPLTSSRSSSSRSNRCSYWMSICLLVLGIAGVVFAVRHFAVGGEPPTPKYGVIWTVNKGDYCSYKCRDEAGSFGEPSAPFSRQVINNAGRDPDGRDPENLEVKSLTCSFKDGAISISISDSGDGCSAHTVTKDGQGCAVCTSVDQFLGQSHSTGSCCLAKIGPGHCLPPPLPVGTPPLRHHYGGGWRNCLSDEDSMGFGDGPWYNFCAPRIRKGENGTCTCPTDVPIGVTAMPSSEFQPGHCALICSDPMSPQDQAAADAKCQSPECGPPQNGACKCVAVGGTSKEGICVYAS
jgi:hypothetical protein